MTARLSILLVEDEPLIAMMLEDFIESLGHCVAGIADSVSAALELVNNTAFDLAILDVHLRDREPSWPVADALADRGKPFLLATGGHVDAPPPRHAAAAILDKPFTMNGVQAALEDIVLT